MIKICTNKCSVSAHTFMLLFYIFVSRIVAETATQDNVFPQVGVDPNELNSSIKSSTGVEKTELSLLNSATESKEQEICGLDYLCENGGKCSNVPEKLCECKSGTSGTHCNTVDECVQKPYKCGFDTDAQCVYDAQEEKAVCKCKTQRKLFDKEKLKCRKRCMEDLYCSNGGKCVNNLCQCLPGTSGDDCGIVDACSTDAKTRQECGDPDDVRCVYNVTTQKQTCGCTTIDYFYDPYDMTCKECDCGPDGNCSFSRGEKMCDCKDDYAVNEYEWDWIYGNRKRCIACECGQNSSGCAFPARYEKECYCYEGYDQDYYGKCARCDCGQYGKCHFDGWKKMCDCNERYADNDGTCETCYCGPNGDCAFQNGNRTCTCEDGYSVDDSIVLFQGICRRCDCFMEKEGGEVGCTFSSGTGIKHCLCPEGYKERRDKCVDIDECLELDACPENTVCKNTPGSYECSCKPGYKPRYEEEVKMFGCDDIDECMESFPCPYTDTTRCENTPGSYKCVCKAEYVSVYENTPERMGCWEDQVSWKFGYIFLIILFTIISFMLLIAICRRYSKNSR